jgi:hypothetical protein
MQSTRLTSQGLSTRTSQANTGSKYSSTKHFFEFILKSSRAFHRLQDPRKTVCKDLYGTLKKCSIHHQPPSRGELGHHGLFERVASDSRGLFSRSWQASLDDEGHAVDLTGFLLEYSQAITGERGESEKSTPHSNNFLSSTPRLNFFLNRWRNSVTLSSPVLFIHTVSLDQEYLSTAHPKGTKSPDPLWGSNPLPLGHESNTLTTQPPDPHKIIIIIAIIFVQI